MITHIKFVSIPSRDQDRSLKFYTEKLGFKVVTDQPMGEGQRWIELRLGAAETKFVLFTPPGAETLMGSMFNGAFAADDVDKTYDELLARGVVFVEPPTDQPWGKFAIFKDPDGNRFVLSSR